MPVSMTLRITGSRGLTPETCDLGRALLRVETMGLHASRCPAKPEEVAESYVMETLDAADVAAFDKHLLVCDECWAVVEVTEQYVRAMRAAAEQLHKDSTGPLPDEPDAN
jgi:hypothetical protein